MRRTALILVAFGVFASGAASAEDAGFKDWWAVCDNVRTCSAYGFSPEGAEETGYIRIERGAAPADAPRVSIGTLGSPRGAWRALMDGKPIPGLETFALEVTEDGDIQVDTLSPAQSEAFVSAARNGGSVALVRDGKAGPVISLAGSSAALRWIDDRQKRAGTAGAMVAKGGKPMNAQPPVAPLVRPAAAVDQSKLPKKVPASVLALRGECDEDMDLTEEMWTPEVHRLAPGRLLWIVPCSRGAYNIIADLFTADEKGGGARAEQVTYGEGEQTSTLMNVAYDVERRVLSNFDRARGLGDCGAEQEWTWTGATFEWSRQILMGECRGVMMDDWPTTFVTRDR